MLGEPKYTRPRAHDGRRESETIVREAFGRQPKLALRTRNITGSSIFNFISLPTRRTGRSHANMQAIVTGVCRGTANNPSEICLDLVRTTIYVSSTYRRFTTISKTIFPR